MVTKEALEEHCIKHQIELSKYADGIIGAVNRNNGFCPCGNKAHTKENECPCDNHLNDVKEHGQCECNLFVEKK